MSKIKLLLDVVEDVRAVADSLIPVIERFKNLAESLQAVADALASTETIVAPSEGPKGLPQEVKTEVTPSLEQVRAVLADKSRMGFTAEIRTLLQKYGAAKLSGIDPVHYKALVAEAEVLGDGS